MVLDLKDAFFTIPLHPLSQPLSAFTWQCSKTHVSQQLTWTILPQEFRDSPHFFGQALQKDLQTPNLAPSHLLQYVDDLLFCNPTWKLCLQYTAKLLGALGSWGYRVSWSKAHVVQTNVTYLGLSIFHQQRTIAPERIQDLINCPLPKTKRELLSILGLLNFFRIWIPNFSLIAKLLYEATERCLDEPLFNHSVLANPLHQLTQSLLRVPTLHLPDHSPDYSFSLPIPTKDRPWDFCVSGPETPGLPQAICQNSWTWWPRKAWPPCIQAMVAIAALVSEADKLSRHAPLTVCSPHTFRDLLSHRALLSLPPSRVQVLHAFLLDPQLSFSLCSPLNPSSLLSTSSATDPLLHSFSLTVDLSQTPSNM